MTDILTNVLNPMIRTYMNLDQDRVFNYAQDIKAPTDKNLWIVLSIENTKTMGAKSEFNQSTLTDNQYISMAARVNIEICSRGQSAIERKEELPMMLKSILAQQYMEDHNVRIDRAGDIQDLSAAEGPGILKRFRFPVMVFYVKSKTATTTQYFDKSKANVEVIEA